MTFPFQNCGGRNPWRRGFSDRPNRSGLVSGDSNHGSRRGNPSDQTSHFGFNPRPPPQRYQNSQPPPPPYNQFQRQRLPFDQNQRDRPFRPRPQKQLEHRSWEYAPSPPPPNSEKFTILTYNILADYLAISHRPKLYFHIPRYMLDWEWRRKSLSFELGLWSADIMCFQEVDRFQDLEEDLKPRGYTGIWKMRTGNAIDGCAIFWKTSRFKLLYDESIQFNKFDLRDNVAQICVLEVVSRNATRNTKAPLRRVVVCSIHVLFNPRRGDIKLSQVRRLLDRAHVVSSTWNNAPVVLCGDFNCTPKSPLYNFISEQKLELSGLDRDKISGQASAEIRSPRSFNATPGFGLASSVTHSPTIYSNEFATEPNNSSLDKQEQNSTDGDVENVPSGSNLSKPSEALQDFSGISCTSLQSVSKVDARCDEGTKSTEHAGLDFTVVVKGSPFAVQVDRFREISSDFSEYESPLDQSNHNKQKDESPRATSSEDLNADISSVAYREANIASFSHQGSLSKISKASLSQEHGADFCNLVTDDHSSSIRINEEDLHAFHSKTSSSGSFSQTQSPDSLEISTPGISASQESQLIANNETASTSSSYQVDCLSTDIEEKVEILSLYSESETLVKNVLEDEKTFSAELCKNIETDLGHSSEELSSTHNIHVSSPTDGVFEDLSPFEEIASYNPSLWTPVEIATATGSEDVTFLEHPMQLKSAYTEVEDSSGTRDCNGEPFVTSYNRRFKGTVDYIWRSKGLKTVRVLAPLSNDAMKWTPGFPTKKWGSDHIALASELAFMDGEINQNA